MHTHVRVLVSCLVAATMTVAARAQHHPPGAGGMGFDQDHAAHHFQLTPDGGSIAVVVTNQDAATLAQVRAHLQQIAVEFADGRFDKPFATHGETPAGVDVMRKRRAMIRYRYEEVAQGGRVTITTADAKARDAVHAFLRYQIREHATGDPLTVRSPGSR